MGHDLRSHNDLVIALERSGRGQSKKENKIKEIYTYKKIYILVFSLFLVYFELHVLYIYIYVHMYIILYIIIYMLWAKQINLVQLFHYV